jgi:hypothetical protein
LEEKSREIETAIANGESYAVLLEELQNIKKEFDILRKGG